MKEGVLHVPLIQPPLFTSKNLELAAGSSGICAMFILIHSSSLHRTLVDSSSEAIYNNGTIIQNANL